MSGDRDWSAAPVHRPADGHPGPGLEARGASATERPAPAPGRVHGTPAPQYGEYAPEGWVNPVLVEQERQERAAESRALREQAAREAAEATARARSRPGSRAAGTTDGGPARAATASPSSRYGRSPLDFGATVGLLVLGLVSVLQSLWVGQVASAVRETFEQRYATLSDPASLTTAAIVGALAGVVLFAGTVWWSLRRLRARRWTFWVPLLGGAVSTVVSVTAFLVVVSRDQAFVEAVLRQAGGA